LISKQNISRSFLDDFLIEAKIFKVKNSSKNSLAIEKFIPIPYKNESVFLRIEFYFEGNILSKIILSSNTQLSTLDDILKIYSSKYSIESNLREDNFRFIFRNNETSVKSITAYTYNTINEEELNLSRYFKKIDFYKIQIDLI
jgi:hypothetical protein